jgi:hypothetical protein
MDVTFKDASPEFRAAIQAIEDRADKCFEPLRILGLPSNLAAWSLLTGAIAQVEGAILQWGDNSPHLDAALLNISRLIPTAMKWVTHFGKMPSTLPVRWGWDDVLASKVAEAITVAHNYDTFLTCFPMWHRNRYAATLLSPDMTRFTAVGGPRGRQVAAYQKGLRPIEGRHKQCRPEKPQPTQELRDSFIAVLRSCKREGRMRFRYSDPLDLWQKLLPEYRARVDGICRRDESLDLGEYTLAEFKLFYAALLAICAAHEHLCFIWERHYGLFPLDSAVLIWSRTRWASAVSNLAGLAQAKCECMINDISFDVSRSLDLHVHPFVPLDSQTLALAPQFPLHSRPDENILRVCSNTKSSVFDVATLTKEFEMRETLSECGTRYRLLGPITLPSPLPDIDLIVEDAASSTVLITELKWIRKTLRSLEILDRDSEVQKGIDQLEKIRSFLDKNPLHLRRQGKLSQPLESYAHIIYILVARDHWLWIEPNGRIALVEFEPFLRMLRESQNLRDGIEDLLKYEWLPVEEKDFTVRYQRSTANGAAIESEIFYSI